MSYNDFYMWSHFENIVKYCNIIPTTTTHQQGLVINNLILISKRKTKFRPLSELDWAWYTPKGMGTAISEDNVLAYYEKMLKDKRSPPNIWKRRHEEMEMKTRYAVNANRASWI